MTNSSTQNDTMTIAFYHQDVLLESLILIGVDPRAPNDSIDNYTQVNLENDYFIPSNGLTVVIEDDRIDQFSVFLQRGNKVVCEINGNQIFIGYVFDYRLEYSRGGGTKLTFMCKDLLEYLAQGTVLPNLGLNTNTNFHFPPQTTLHDALQAIANSFSQATSSDIITIMPDDSQSASFATGFKTGFRKKGKTPASRIKSLSNALNVLTTPMKGESYLAYMTRLAKHAGANLKMALNDDSTIICKPPTYDRTNPSPYQLIHYLADPQNVNNNVLSANFNFTLDKQPSVVIVEGNTPGDGKFYQNIVKGVAINELTAYPIDSKTAISSVGIAIANLTAGALGTGWKRAPFNDQLFAIRSNMAIDIDTQVSMPFYTVDYNANTNEQIDYAASKILSEHQDHYVEFTYRVQGWTMAGTNYVWQPDQMVTIMEEVFNPNGSAYQVFPMWIRRVNFVKNRSSGAETEIICTLPYTHNFEMTT